MISVCDSLFNHPGRTYGLLRFLALGNIYGQIFVQKYVVPSLKMFKSTR